jgi:hypothetical protein
MVHCLLDDTIKVVTFAKENKKHLKDLRLNGDFQLREEDFTFYLNNGYVVRIVSNTYTTYRIKDDSTVLISTESYKYIEDALAYIKKLFSGE